MNRRRFLRTAFGAAVAAPVLGTAYGMAEASLVAVVRQEVVVPRLPSGFRGVRVALVADVHHGPFVSLDFVESVVRMTQALGPDLIVLGGDYSLTDGKYIAPCFEVLAGLSAPLGVYGVLGNHDYNHGLRDTRDGMTAANVTELTNAAAAVDRGGDRLWLAGVDDLWRGRPDPAAALTGVGPDAACVLVSHNPDVAETVTDPRVGLVLSGHTHGGQIHLPGIGAPWIRSPYGQKYAHGLVDAPHTQVYVSAGVGVTGLPVRIGRRPEIALLTLT